MTTNFSFGINNLNFNDIQQELKDYFESMDYKYIEGGNFDLLIKTLSYITLLNSQHISNTINNLFISSANSKEAIYLLAKQIGYVPRRRIPSKTTISAVFTPVTTNSETFTISQMLFSGQNTTYNFIASNILFTLDNTYNNYRAIFEAEEKTAASIDYYGTAEINQEILLPTVNIAKYNFSVKSLIGSVEYDWELVNSYDQVPDENSRVYFIDVNNKNEVRLIFGNGVIGQVPQSNEKITVDYYTTNGLDGNNETDFEIINIISSSIPELSNKSNYVFSYSQSFGGSDYESIEEIQKLAPKHFSSGAKHIVEKDFDALIEYADDFVAYADLENINYVNEGLGKNYLSLVPLDYRTESLTTKKSNNYPDGTFPVSELTNLITDSTTQEDINSYYNGWVTLQLISPTYLWVNIQPYIEIKQNKVFSNVEDRVFTNLLDYVEDENFESNIFGFDKQFRNSAFIKTMNSDSDVVSSKIDVLCSLMVSKESILDKYFLQIPENFLATNSNHFNNLILHNSYPYSELLVEDRTIYCDGLEDSNWSSGNEFERFIVSDDLSYQSSTTEMFTLTFNSAKEIIGSNIKNIYINKKLITINIYPYENIPGSPETYFVNGIPLLYSQDNIKEVNNSSYLYNYSRTEKTYFVYLKYQGTSYLFGEIVLMDDPIDYMIFKEVDDRYAIRKLLTLLNLSQFSTAEILEYTFINSLVLNQNQYSITGKISLSSSSALYQNSMNMKLVSRKKFASIRVLSTPQITIEDSAIFDYVLDETNKYIKFYTVDDPVNPVVIYQYDDSTVFQISTDNYSSDLSLINYKSNKFSFTQNNNVLDVYCYDKYDDTKLADIDISDGSITFNSVLDYYEDYNSSTSKNITLSDMLSEIVLLDSTIYQMRLLSQNQIGDLENINENFDTNGIIFLIPNLNHLQEI